jgi:hypothetical protein
MTPVLNFQKKASFADRQAIDVDLFKRKCLLFRSKSTTLTNKFSNMEFLLLAQYEISPEGAFRIDLSVAAGEDNGRPFVLPPRPADKTPDVPFSAPSERTGIENNNIGLFQGTIGKSGPFQVIGHHIRIPLIRLATGCMDIECLHNPPIDIADFKEKEKS